MLLITGNEGKRKEFAALLGLNEHQFNAQSFDLPEIQSLDIREIGAFKTRMALRDRTAFDAFDAILTDDTAVYCDGLNGLPGPLIKWFLESLGREGLIELLRNRQTSGSVTCLLSLGIVDRAEIIQFEGTVKGQFVPPRGEHGFGWDPIFLPAGQKRTYGEMEADEKNTISHRAVALKQLRQWLISG